MVQINFHLAGNVQKVEEEINNGANVSIKNELGLSPLFVAVENGNVNYSLDLLT